MRTPRTLVAASAVLLAVLAGCSTAVSAADAGSTTVTATTDDGTTVTSVAAGSTADEVLAANLTVHDAAQDDPGDATGTITLDGGSASSDADGVSVDDAADHGTVVTITAGGTYTVSGTLDDGQIVVAAGDEVVRLVLDDADVSSSTSAAIWVQEAGSVTVELAAGSQNSLSDTTAYGDGEDEPTGALYSTADLAITGEGSLTVHGNANDAIVGKDGLVISGGTLTVDAVDDGIRGKDYLVITGGTLDVTAGGDGLKSDEETDATAGFVHLAGGDVTVTAGGDGVQAETDAVVTGGTLEVTAGGGAGATVADDTSAKGVKGNASVVVDQGTVTVDAADDAIHSNGIVTLTDGAFDLASGDDGVHADVALDVTGGTITVSESYEGLEAEAITLAGGTIDVTASDDGVNAASSATGSTEDANGDWGGPQGETSGTASLTITGGTIHVDAGGDGLDANGTLTMSGGDVVVDGPTDDGNGALDVDGTFEVTGGTLVAAGSSGMAIAPGTDGQGWVSATFSSTQSAGTVLEIVASDGTVVATYTATKQLTSLVVSDAAIVSGDTYTITADGAEVLTVTAGEHTAGGMGGGGGQPGGQGGGQGGQRP